MSTTTTTPRKFTASDIRRAPLDLGNGRTAKVSFEHDQDHGAPWKESDGHGVITDWETRDKRAGERILSTDRRAKRFYDFAASMVIAKRDGWGIANPPGGATKGQIAALAVEADFEFCRGWCADLWQYVVISVTVTDEDGKEIANDSLGGVEDFNGYHYEQAADMLNALVDQLNEQDVNEPACHI